MHSMNVMGAQPQPYMQNQGHQHQPMRDYPPNNRDNSYQASGQPNMGRNEAGSSGAGGPNNAGWCTPPKAYSPQHSPTLNHFVLCFQGIDGHSLLSKRQTTPNKAYKTHLFSTVFFGKKSEIKYNDVCCTTFLV